MVRTRLAAITGLIAALSVFSAAPASAATVTLYTVMTGAAERPTPNNSPATGDATVYVYDDNTVCVVLRVSNLTSPVTGAHIHIGGPSEAGPVVMPLNPPVNGFSYTCSRVSAQLAQGLRTNPGAYYVNVHTTQFPGGEIRGQLRAV